MNPVARSYCRMPLEAEDIKMVFDSAFQTTLVGDGDRRQVGFVVEEGCLRAACSRMVRFAGVRMAAMIHIYLSVEVNVGWFMLGESASSLRMMRTE